MVLAAPDAMARPLFGAGAASPKAGSAGAAASKAGSGGGGLVTILMDHVQFVANPASAEQPFPEGQSNAAREAHRQVHASLFEAVGGGAAGKAAAAGVNPAALAA